jgi:hypothetical protein
VDNDWAFFQTPQQEDKMKLRFLIVVAIMLAWLLIAPTASAQGPTPPTLPSLEQLFAMTLSEIGALVFVGMFAWAFGYLINAVAQALPFKVDAKIWDMITLVVTGTVAFGWNLLAQQLNILYPGLLGTTVGGALLLIVQWLVGLATARVGGIESARYIQSLRPFTLEESERSGAAIFLGG